jgi:hypothetical protein
MSVRRLRDPHCSERSERLYQSALSIAGAGQLWDASELHTAGDRLPSWDAASPRLYLTRTQALCAVAIYLGDGAVGSWSSAALQRQRNLSCSLWPLASVMVVQVLAPTAILSAASGLPPCTVDLWRDVPGRTAPTTSHVSLALALSFGLLNRWSRNRSVHCVEFTPFLHRERLLSGALVEVRQIKGNDISTPSWMHD